MQVPETVQASDRHLYVAANQLRVEIKETASALYNIAKGQHSNREAGANLMLTYRHLEDASMRLGKVLQALDGGVSVYDKETTVGVTGDVR